MTTIKVVDAAPGTGKTFAKFEYMKQRPDYKWMFVTPRLDEIDRIQGKVVGEKGCPELSFKAPESRAKKSEVLVLIESGENIACTHALFDDFTPEHITAIKHQGYHIVFDEEIDTCSLFACPVGDVQRMEKKQEIEVVGKEKRIVLRESHDEYDDPTSNSKKVADAAVRGTLYCGLHEGKIAYLVSHIPIELIKAAASVTVLTHNFKGSMFESFLQIHDLDWKYLNLDLRFSNSEVKAKLKSLISFPEPPRSFKKLDRLNLSYTFLEKRATQEQLKQVGAGILAVTSIYPDQSKVMFTTRKENSERKSPRSIFRTKDRDISKNYVAFNSRATNQYAHMNVVVHAIERVPNPKFTGYFASHDADFTEDGYALSELIQFIFRSAVRNGQPIDLYIASARMKKLFQDWLDDVEDELLEDVAA